MNKFKTNLIFLMVLLFGLISIVGVNAVVSGLGLTIWVHNVTDKGTNGFGYGAGGFNYTNVSTNRPYITFNVSTTFYLAPLQANNSFNVTLAVVPRDGALSATTGLSARNNMTVFLRNQTNTIYFNQSYADGYYTWYLNVTNDSLSTLPPAVGAGNASNVTDFYTILIDTNAPNITQYGVREGYSQSSTSISINTTTEDVFQGTTIDTVGGGFVSFYLRNESGVLNWSVRPRNAFGSANASANLTFNLPAVGVSLSDGVYFYNVSVNDSLGNTRWRTNKEYIIDTKSPVVTITSSAGTTMNRLATTTLTCNAVDTSPANISMSISGETLACEALTNSSSCQIVDFKPAVAETKTVTCTALDRVARSTSTTLSLTVQSDDTTSGGSGSSGGGGGGSGTETVSTSVAILANEPFTYSINNENIGVDSVTLTTSETVDAKISVSSLSDVPSGASTPTGTIYKYFEVKKENLQDTALSEAKIAFTVSKEWLTQNNGNVADVVLQRLHNDVWESYTAAQVGETDTAYKFTATVPGFSSFAIGLKSTATTPAVTSETSDVVATDTTAEDTEKTSFMPILIVLIVLALVGVAVWYFVEKRK